MIRDNIIQQKQSVSNPGEIESNFLSSLQDESIFEKIYSGFDSLLLFQGRGSHLFSNVISRGASQG